MMTPRRLRKYQRGQGLIEYALILILVAVVVIVVAGLVGLAVQRVYGLVVGALGTKYDTVGHLAIDPPGAICYYMNPYISKDPNEKNYPNGFTLMSFTGQTDIPFADLTYTTDGRVGTALDGKDAPIKGTSESATTGAFAFNYVLSNTPPFSCPHVVIIQAKTGAIAISPVTECWQSNLDPCPSQ